MARSTFEQMCAYIGEKTGQTVAEGAILELDGQKITLSEGALAGSLNFETTLGVLLMPVREERLHELIKSNFLGINTGGCTFAFDSKSVKLRAHVPVGSGAHESWEWLHRLLHVANEWKATLKKWEEFIAV